MDDQKVLLSSQDEPCGIYVRVLTSMYTQTIHTHIHTHSFVPHPTPPHTSLFKASTRILFSFSVCQRLKWSRPYSSLPRKWWKVLFFSWKKRRTKSPQQQQESMNVRTLATVTFWPFLPRPSGCTTAFDRTCSLAGANVVRKYAWKYPPPHLNLSSQDTHTHGLQVYEEASLPPVPPMRLNHCLFAHFVCYGRVCAYIANSLLEIWEDMWLAGCIDTLTHPVKYLPSPLPSLWIHLPSLFAAGTGWEGVMRGWVEIRCTLKEWVIDGKKRRRSSSRRRAC